MLGDALDKFREAFIEVIKNFFLGEAVQVFDPHLRSSIGTLVNEPEIALHFWKRRV